MPISYYLDELMSVAHYHQLFFFSYANIVSTLAEKMKKPVRVLGFLVDAGNSVIPFVPVPRALLASGDAGSRMKDQ